MTELQDWIQHGAEMRRPLLANPKLKDHQKIIIVGGGLSGLCTAYRIGKKYPQKNVILVEKSDRLGGVIQSWKKDEWICDLAVNASRPHPSMWRLIDDLGLAELWKPSTDKVNSRWVWLNGSKHKISPFSLFKIGPFKLIKAVKRARNGGKPVSQLIPHGKISDAMTLGIVNDTSDNVDADFLFPSLTKFGPNPPISNGKLAKQIAPTYPIFQPKSRSIASLKGGMEVLVKALKEQLEAMSNVEILLNHNIANPQFASEQFATPISSIIWTAPGLIDDYQETSLSIFAVGFEQQQVKDVPLGYGLLIPDKSIPISGILHESDLHHSKRAPEGHRLFRLMVPHERWDHDDSSVKESLSTFFGNAQPVLFENIGSRIIPRFKPGHMEKISKLSYQFTYLGWSVSGVAITHVVDEAERLLELLDS
jgi:protoporphyrinogen oxidase